MNITSEKLNSDDLHRVHLYKVHLATITKARVQQHTGELGYDRLNGTRKIGPSYAKSVVYI